MADVPATLVPFDARTAGKSTVAAITVSVVVVCSCGHRIPMNLILIAGRPPLKQQCARCSTIVYIAQVTIDVTVDPPIHKVVFGYEMPNIVKPV